MVVCWIPETEQQEGGLCISISVKEGKHSLHQPHGDSMHPHVGHPHVGHPHVAPPQGIRQIDKPPIFMRSFDGVAFPSPWQTLCIEVPIHYLPPILFPTQIHRTKITWEYGC